MITPAPGCALSELQGVLRSRIGDRPVSAFEVDTVLIPGILAGRRDIAQGLRGGPTGMIADGDCLGYRTGTWVCRVRSIFGICALWECVLDGGGECSVLEPIDCPDALEGDEGSGGGDRRGGVVP